MADEAAGMDADVAMQAAAGMSDGDAPRHDDARDLVWQVKHGDPGAFETLMRRHERLVLGIALRLLGHADDARDAAQEVFLRLFRYAASLDHTQPLIPWLSRVTVNVCRDAIRQRMSARQVFAFDETAVERAAAPGEGSDAAVLLGQRKRLLREALALVPERERLALVLRDVQGLPTQDVARMLGTTEVTVRTQVSRGRLRLKRILDGMVKGTRR
jgi:RNA polymerase sigma-70 factor, ECF subfamily